MDKDQKFAILAGAVSELLPGGKSELAAMIDITPVHLSRMLAGKKTVTDNKLILLEKIATEILPPGFGFQDHVITDLSEIWSKETIVMAEAAAKLRGLSLEEYVQAVAREDLRPMFEKQGSQTQPVNENDARSQKKADNQSRE